MKRALGLVVSFILVIGSTTLATSVKADGDDASRVTKLAVEELEPNPRDIIRSRMGLDPSKFDGIGNYFDASTENLYSALATTPQGIGNQLEEQDWSLCTSPVGADCVPSFGKLLHAYSVLGICRDSNELGCIEDVQISIGGSTRQSMINLGHIGQESYFAENKSLSIARGSSPLRFQAPDGTHYVVTAQTHRIFIGENNQWTSKVGTRFQVQIKRVSPSAVLEANTVSIQDNPNYPGKKQLGLKISQISALKFQDQTAFTVKIRLPNVVGGWFQARVKDGVIGSTQLTGDRTVYEFSGTVAPVIIAGGVVRFSDLPDNFLSKNLGITTEIPPSSNLGPTNPGEGMVSLAQYQSWLPYLGENALTTIDQWNIRSSGWPISNSCFTALKGVTGFIATNAAAYVGLPPSWDPTTGSLDYKVAAPHFDENGNVNVGNYTLSFPVAAAKCLYGSTELPPTVDVTVGEEGADPNFASKVGLTESNGWVNFSTTGFHYSSPTIKVKLGRASLGSAGNGVLSVKVKKKLTAKAIAKFAGLSVKAGSTVSLRVAASSRSRCSVSGTSLIANATGRCKVTVTVKPRRGKSSSKTVSVTVTGSPTITRKISATAKAIAEHAKLEAPTGSTISLKVARSSAKVCRVSRTKAVGLKSGTCRVTVTVKSAAGIVSSKTVNLKVT